MDFAENGWEPLESWLRAGFNGLMRKNGVTEMVEHSIAVGRAVLDDGEDAVVVFAAYTHDVFEDVPVFMRAPMDIRKRMLMPIAMAALGNETDATDAVELTSKCCYTDAEYSLPKKERKKAATARWLADGDIRVLVIKVADVNHNESDSHTVSPEFAREFISWAGPFRDAARARIAKVRGGTGCQPGM